MCDSAGPPLQYHVPELNRDIQICHPTDTAEAWAPCFFTPGLTGATKEAQDFFISRQGLGQCGDDPLFCLGGSWKWDEQRFGHARVQCQVPHESPGQICARLDVMPSLCELQGCIHDGMNCKEAPPAKPFKDVCLGKEESDCPKDSCIWLPSQNEKGFVQPGACLVKPGPPAPSPIDPHPSWPGGTDPCKVLAQKSLEARFGRKFEPGSKFFCGMQKEEFFGECAELIHGSDTPLAQMWQNEANEIKLAMEEAQAEGNEELVGVLTLQLVAVQLARQTAVEQCEGFADGQLASEFCDEGQEIQDNLRDTIINRLCGPFA